MDKKIKNLVKFLDHFKDMPITLAYLLLKHNALSIKFEQRLEGKIADRPKKIHNISKLFQFYDALFQLEQESDLFKQLQRAVELQEFEKAVKIRDRLIKKGLLQKNNKN